MRVGRKTVVLFACFASGAFWFSMHQKPSPEAQDIALKRLLPTGRLRVTAFGTSLSAPPQVWPDDFSEALVNCRGAEVQMTRVVGPGKSSGWAVERLQEVVETRPDVVLIEFAINDADILDGQSLKSARANHQEIISGLRTGLSDTRIVLMAMSPAQKTRGWLRPRLSAHYHQYHDLAVSEETGFVDLYSRWLLLPRDARGLERDGLHPEPSVASGVISPVLAGYFGCPMPS